MLTDLRTAFPDANPTLLAHIGAAIVYLYSTNRALVWAERPGELA